MNNSQKGTIMTIYIYRTSTAPGDSWLSWLAGCRYVAYDREWPWGRNLAFGSTVEGTVRRARRKATQLARTVPTTREPIIVVPDETDPQ